MRYLLCALVADAFLSGRAVADEGKVKANKRLLVITESRGFVHGVVNRPGDYRGQFRADKLSALTFNGQELTTKDDLQVTFKDGKTVARLNGKEVEFKSYSVTRPCLVEQTFLDLGAKHGFEVVCSQDSRAEITADNLAKYDAVFFYTTGELPLTDAQKTDLLDFVRGGKGFAGSHCATDTFYKWPAYGELIGAYFDGHPWHKKINVVVEDQKHPATRHLGAKFEITDEIYQFRTPYDRGKLRVLMHMDMTNETGGNRQDKDNALAWVKEFGQGRVFYTALGHRDEVWKDERFQQHVLGGLRWIFKLEEGDAKPK
jgi:type 1 glutamine amidotransferase